MHNDDAPSDALDPQIMHAQEVYTKRNLALYDFLVLRVFYPLVWRCPPNVMLRLYDRSVGARHLDLGPGTGYFVDRCRFPVTRPEITLLDLNIECLKMSERRLARYQPKICCANLMQPLPLPRRHYDSVALNLVLHTIPGGWETKGVVFEHIAACLKPGGVLFGSTLLARGIPMNSLTRHLMAEQYRRGICQNDSDDAEGLTEQLQKYFSSFKLVIRGCVALFRITVGD